VTRRKVGWVEFRETHQSCIGAYRFDTDKTLYTAIMPCVMPGAGSVLQPIR
jgi:hypothetical protein